MTQENSKQPQPFSGDHTPHDLLVLSVISFLVYAAIAWVIFTFLHEGPMLETLTTGISPGNQLLIGLMSGAFCAVTISFFADRSPLSGVLDDFYLFRVISQTPFSWFDRIQLSLFAGVGEELLFRGAVQPVLGIWMTTIIFVGLHGYFKFQKPGHILFGALMFGLSMVLGYLFEYAGLLAAMSAHAVYDVIMLHWVSRDK
ncbi:MAG: CPBP family intramembrane glutamic endopeptidase [Balneolaceae bacterium]|nr:CPBP family intramembrane glutamic endopeptidase [Balneolaceae bacterium]